MKVIGMLGGMSWESTAEYYRIVNEAVRARLGGQHSAKTLLYSVDFHDVERLQREGRWDEADALMVECARRLERGGADFLVICTNTMHRSAPAVERAVGLPLLHIADATAERVKGAGVKRLGLLATRFTMEQDFYKGRLAERHGLEVLVPEEEDRRLIHAVIYDELSRGRIRAESRREYLRVMDGLAARGAEAVLLGCTEITLLVKPEDTNLRLFDTTRIHAEEAVTLALQNP
jgi:aspartate racemase